jgi:hypothetical protein
MLYPWKKHSLIFARGIVCCYAFTVASSEIHAIVSWWSKFTLNFLILSFIWCNMVVCVSSDLFDNKAYTDGNAFWWYRPSPVNTYVKTPGFLVATVEQNWTVLHKLKLEMLFLHGNYHKVRTVPSRYRCFEGY